MSDPKHLTDDGSEATDLERELLLAAQDVHLAAPEKQAIWAGVALQCLPVVGPPTAASAGLGAGSKLGLGVSPLLKGLLVMASLGGASAGAYWLARAPSSVSPQLAAPALASAQASAGVAPSTPPPSTPRRNCLLLPWSVPRRPQRALPRGTHQVLPRAKAGYRAKARPYWRFGALCARATRAAHCACSSKRDNASRTAR